MYNDHSQTVQNIDKTWAVVSGEEILLEQDTRPKLEQAMQTTDLPDNHEVVALPTAYWSVIV